ncbi:hypothetical protein GGI07_002755 [Coemansia sp. Benny D115]|nr:hypothetical protein GGI07_002755 [Coemansia sp. Benny D115]
MTKKNRSPSNKSPPLDGEEQEQYSERNTWSPQDTDAFHYVLSKYTSFNDGKLELSHRYFDARDISLVEKMDTKRMANRAAGKDGPSDEDILLELKRTNDGNSAKNYKIVFSLLRELQAAVGGRYTVRQINTKMINSRSRWSVPFQSLHEVGYLIKNQAARGGRRTDSVTGNFINPPRTNIEKKNLAAIKALLKYCTNRHTFWNDEAGAKPFNNMYSGQSTSSIVMLPSDATEDIPEPERFIRAMIKRHGVNMMNGFGGMMTAEGMTPKAPYEDDYLSQYINFNTSFTAPVTSTGITSADINAVLNGYGGDEGSSYPDNGSNGRNDMGSTPPGGILEGIGNLTVNGHSEVHTPVKGKNPIAGNPGQKHYSHYEETNSKAQRVSDDIGYPSISQRRHSHAAGLPYNALPLGFGHPLPAQNPLFLENSLSGDQSLRGLRNQEWSSNDRLSTSTGNAAAPVGAGTSMDNKSAFTFNIPNSWSDETSVNEPPMQTPTYQGNFGMSHQQQQGVSFSTAMLAQLPATLDNYRIPNFNDASEQLQQRRQSVHQSINIPDGNGMQSQASFVPAMSNQVEVEYLKNLMVEVLSSEEALSCDAILLSGGLDTSIASEVLRGRGGNDYKSKLVTGITLTIDPESNALAKKHDLFKQQPQDVVYARRIAAKIGLDHHVLEPTLEELLDGPLLETCVRVLRTFDGMEMRNALVIAHSLAYAKKIGCRRVCTGDGADELFAGYSFMQGMSADGLLKYTRNMVKTMSFCAFPLAKEFGLEVWSPYLDKRIIDYATSDRGGLLELKVGEFAGQMHGKLLLRKAFPNVVSAARKKEPIECGSGTTVMPALAELVVSDAQFKSEANHAREQHGIVVHDKERLLYFRAFKAAVLDCPQVLNTMERFGEDACCPDCKFRLKDGSSFCNVCGLYPARPLRNE